MKALIMLRLLAVPILIIGGVQLFFGMLSLWFFKEEVGPDFFIPALFSIMLASSVLLLTWRERGLQISFRQSLAFVSLTWVVCALDSAFPIYTIEQISYTDAVFEAMSGLTTTGATILSNLDIQPRSFLLYRQFLQWLGGMGVVVFVVAVLPMLNVGGMKIFRAEVPGPAKDEKLVPRLVHTSRYLWYIYTCLTLACALGYMLAGMTPFDALAHSFTTVSTGGFSTHDASIGYFDSNRVEFNSEIFMILGAISFALHFKFSRVLSLKVYAENEEARVFLWIIPVFACFLLLLLLNADIGLDPERKVLSSLFHLISFLTSTGYAADDYTGWPLAALLFLIFAGYIGGCAGSTAGGNKIIRNIISLKVIGRQLKELSHPRGVYAIRYNRRPVSREVSAATMSYMVAAAILSVVLTLLLQLTGLDFWTAFSAVAACLNVLGPAFGEAGAGFQPISDAGTWVLTCTMLLGRLEFYTVLALLTPVYWRD